MPATDGHVGLDPALHEFDPISSTSAQLLNTSLVFERFFFLSNPGRRLRRLAKPSRPWGGTLAKRASTASPLPIPEVQALLHLQLQTAKPGISAARDSQSSGPHHQLQPTRPMHDREEAPIQMHARMEGRMNRSTKRTLCNCPLLNASRAHRSHHLPSKVSQTPRRFSIYPPRYHLLPLLLHRLYFLPLSFLPHFSPQLWHRHRHRRCPSWQHRPRLQRPRHPPCVVACPLQSGTCHHQQNLFH
mmetsp:Transcript_43980/g.139480  ORF Transcript_43980/g.139480 Transcript_43980/m.139480 type:complete len:244 (-) Transcript_43980:506-1237(-)